ncbi:MAG TPA: acetyl-CoA carboxylase biotin carboxyl carrier protein subunit [Thermoanaerobaculaceae bacterium]|nr:acetyl-CoA carboxylase biotin carboxyl carrier protein subunit [Thermoanaerobaculaceae bacterium]HRS15684.1 acetyl-CoA carboxylase biotin carboxyl carrier protein subunit [Thermoanaerobaculaceae bacterium]
MKLQARFRDRVHTVEVNREGQRFTVLVDGVPHELDLVFSDASHDVLLIDNSCYDVVSVARPGGYHVNVFNRFFDIDILDHRSRALGGGETAAGGDRPVRAAMPGRIVKVLVEDGQEVAAGAGLVVLEAMKMQNELRAPRAGRVRQLTVRPGQTVEAGQTLLVVGD